MDPNKCLEEVTNLNDYITFTRAVENKRINLKLLPFNMTTILSLKKIRTNEIEYFNKYDENGAATTIFELMLKFPPSKTWSLLGKELIHTLQYWLEAIRKHLIVNNVYWWTFLKLLLKFIKVINTKDSSINKILIEEIAECLLDLATHSVPEIAQRYEIIQTFNSFSAESSQNIRFAFKDNFQHYFVKLSTILATCGDFRLQYSILETLLRWLLPRHDPGLRREAADKWFPSELCNRKALEIFLGRPWQCFIKDARDFLNARNEFDNSVTSVRCTKLTIGTSFSISPKPNREYWLDVNSSTKCISMLLDYDISETLGKTTQACDALVMSKNNTCNVELKRVSHQVVIVATVLDLSQVYPFANNVPESSTDIHMCVESRDDIPRLDRALLGVFMEKYQCSIDFENLRTFTSPEDKRKSQDVINNTDEDTRFSIPVEVRRRKHAGYIVRSKNPGLLNSPSTVSTSSLAQLHEKLAALPLYTFDKEPVSVCAQPQLSNVTEISESEENRTLNTSLSTVRLRTYGVCQKASIRTHNSKISASDDSKENKPGQLSPVVNDNENSVSCLLIATIGSADDSVINDTIERLPKDIPCNTDNIIDLLAKEALQGSAVRQDDGVSIVNKESEVPINYFQVNKYTKDKNPTEVLHEEILESNEERYLNNLQLIDEKSNEIVENTPAHFVTVRRSKRTIKKNIPKTETSKDLNTCVETHNIQEVEDFFTKHVSENNNGDLVISPTLARKINETSSECSEDFDHYLLPRNYIVQDIEKDLLVPDADVVECLNALVDKVCEDFEKCTKYLNVGLSSVRTSMNTNGQGDILHNTKGKKSKQKEKPSKAIKLRVIVNRPLPPKKNLRNSTKINNSTKPFSVMSPIIERETVVEESLTKDATSPKGSDENLETPVLKRKRKLYSPNVIISDEDNVEESELTEYNTTPNSKLRVYSKTPKSTATCYKELERERKKRIRQPRSRRSKSNIETTISPRSQKMNQIFDSLKSKTEGEAVKLVNPDQDIAVYNYTSDEDENDQNYSKTTSAERTKDADTAKTTKAPRRMRKRAVTTTKAKLSSESENNNTKRVQKQTPKRMVNRCKKQNISAIPESNQNLEDERMRSTAPEILNTSILIPSPNETKEYVNREPEPILKHKPEMECIITEEDRKLIENDGKNIKQNPKSVKSKRILSLIRNKDTQKDNVDLIGLSTVDNERTVSPLPGLVVETAQKVEDPDDSVNACMLQKFKNIYQGNAVDENCELNTTQNLLSDLEQNNCSSNQLLITEELEKGYELNEKQTKKSIADCSKSDKENKNKINKSENNKTRRSLKLKPERCCTKSQANEMNEAIHLSKSNNSVSEKSMATMGNTHSPITGHGDFNEDPPNSFLLKQDIEPRIVEQEYLDHSLKEFFTKLTKDMDAMMGGAFYKLDDGNCSSKRNSKSDYCSVTKSHNSKQPVVAITRLTQEDIRSLSSNNSKVSTINKENRKNDVMESFKEIPKEITASDKDKNVRIQKSMKTRSDTKMKLLEARKTMISPIEPFKDSISQIPNNPNSPSLEKEERANHTRPRKPASIQSNTNETSTKVGDKKSSSRKTLKKPIITPIPITSKSSTVDKFEGADSKSCKTSTSVHKRQLSPVLLSSKRSKLIEKNNFATESGPSLSSVDEWFKKNEPCTDASVILSLKDIVKNVLEKLDTTLLEIHHNTSKRFINLFVDCQRHLDDLKKKRQDLYKDTAREIMSGVVKLMDEKFSELNTRSKTIDEEFMKEMKERAHSLLQEDCKQKRVMVTLLQEDVQAVLEHMNRAKDDIS